MSGHLLGCLNCPRLLRNPMNSSTDLSQAHGQRWVLGAVNIWNRQMQRIHEGRHNGAFFGWIFSFTLAIPWAFVAWLSVRGLSSQIWQRLEHKAVSGEWKRYREAECTYRIALGFRSCRESRQPTAVIKISHELTTRYFQKSQK
jgi:hypothetical protein